MIVRWIIAIVLATTLSSCGLYYPPKSRGDVEPGVEPEVAASRAPVVTGDPFPNLESLVVYRRNACRLPEADRTDLLQEYQANESPTGIMATLMLASCTPDKTPGLLANSLTAARKLSQAPPGFEALLDLLSAQLRSYSLVEDRLRATETKLERVISGIRKIETEMGDESSSLGDDL